MCGGVHAASGLVLASTRASTVSLSTVSSFRNTSTLVVPADELVGTVYQYPIVIATAGNSKCPAEQNAADRETFLTPCLPLTPGSRGPESLASSRSCARHEESRCAAPGPTKGLFEIHPDPQIP